MFNERIIFIVGAGASSECGLPTGYQLKEAIAGGVRFQFDAGGLSKGDKDLLDILQARFSNVEPHVKALMLLGATPSSRRERRSGPGLVTVSADEFEPGNSV
jgi:hypothetical protein